MSGNYYMSAGAIMVNDLHYADGSMVKGLVGGGGVYALSGMKLWEDNCAMTANMGQDFQHYIGPWWNDNQITHLGLNLCHEHCIYHQVDYREDGTYDEHSIYPDGFRHDMYMFPRPENFLPYAKDCKALYLAFAPNKYEWAKLGAAKEKYGFTIMWELPTRECEKEYLDDIKTCLQYVDIYSLNKPESYSLFDTNTIEDSINEINKLQKPCYFRVGKAGSYLIMDGKCVFGPTIFGPNDVDATGCGNSSTAAAMIAFDLGYDMAMIVAMGNATSSVNAGQIGPRATTTPQIRAHAKELAQSQYQQIKDTVYTL